MHLHPGDVASGAPRPNRRAPGTDLALLAIGGFGLLVLVILWFDNAQGNLTGNGVFKTAELRPWIRDPANAPLYPSNYLFYPVYGTLCRLLDGLGVFECYICKRCGFVDWYCQDPEHIPIGKQYMTEEVDAAASSEQVPPYE